MGRSHGTSWDDSLVESEIRKVAAGLGRMPTNSELISLGRGDLSNQIAKRGGFVAWAERLSLPRMHSDSDTGWDGEIAFMKIAEAEGIACERSDAVKAPYDLLLGGVCRVDVKAAIYAEYSASRGWFYRIGKHPQADLIVLYQLDTGVFYGIPWWLCPTANVTISRLGGKWADYRNNWPLIRRLIGMRLAERAQCGVNVPEVA